MIRKSGNRFSEKIMLKQKVLPAVGPRVEQEGARADEHADQHQHEAETERQRKLAFAGLQRNRGRHGAGKSPYVAADHDDRTDLGDSAAERGKEGGQQKTSADEKELQDAVGFRQAVDVHQ